MPNEFLLLDPELREQRQQRRRLFKIWGGVALALVVVLLLARPTRHAIKSWQARRHAEKALTLIEQEQWKEGSAEARTAYQLRPTEPAALRAVARLLTRTGQGDALGFWKTLREKQPLTREDLRDEAAAALSAGDVSTADAAVKALSGKSEGGPGPADELLAAQVAAQLGQPEAAAGHLAKVEDDPKASERQQLQAALLQLALSGGETPAMKKMQAAAWGRLTRMARGQDAVALDALTILAQRSLSTPNEIVLDPAIMPDTEVVHALETHPLSKTPQKLVALDLQMHIDPARRADLIEQAITTWKSSDNLSLAALARWLNGKGEFQKELDTIPLERSLQTRDLFLQRLDALGSLGQWAEIERLLTEESFPLDPVIERMYLARCNQQLGEVVAGENNWQRALEATEGDPQKLLTLADYAEKNGATKIAETAYNTIAHDAPRTRAAQQGRLRLAQQTRNTAKIHSILAEMLKQWPNDPAVLNDEAYTRLLLLGKAETLNGGTTSVSSSPGGTSSGAEKAEGRRKKEEVTGKADSGKLTTEIGSPAASPNQLSASSSQLSKSAPSSTQLSAVSSQLSKSAPSSTQLSAFSSQLSESAPSSTQLSAFSSQLSEIDSLAEDLVRREPASLPHRTLLALARLKQGRAEQALEVYANLRIPPNAATPSAVAVHAAVLAAAGRTDDARVEAGAVNRDQLLPEEQALISDLLP